MIRSLMTVICLSTMLTSLPLTADEELPEVSDTETEQAIASMSPGFRERLTEPPIDSFQTDEQSTSDQDRVPTQSTKGLKLTTRWNPLRPKSEKLVEAMLQSGTEPSKEQLDTLVNELNSSWSLRSKKDRVLNIVKLLNDNNHIKNANAISQKIESTINQNVLQKENFGMAYDQTDSKWVLMKTSNVADRSSSWSSFQHESAKTLDQLLRSDKNANIGPWLEHLKSEVQKEMNNDNSTKMINDLVKKLNKSKDQQHKVEIVKTLNAVINSQGRINSYIGDKGNYYKFEPSISNN